MSNRHVAGPAPALILALALAAALPARADGPPWESRAALSARFGGAAGSACQATPMASGLWIAPSHCVGEPSARDYAWLAPSEARQEPPSDAATPRLGRSLIASRQHGAGEFAWVERAGRFERVAVIASGGAQYWLRAEAASFCPGDSGAPVWALEDGRAAWIGMVVSGGERAAPGSPCSRKAVALKSQAVAWPWN